MILQASVIAKLRGNSLGGTGECGDGLLDVGFGGTRIDGAEPENGAAAQFGRQDQRESFLLHAGRDSTVQEIESSGADFFWRPAKRDDCHLSWSADFPLRDRAQLLLCKLR